MTANLGGAGGSVKVPLRRRLFAQDDDVRAVDRRLHRYARASRTYLSVSVVLGVVWAGLIVAQASLLADGLTGAPLGPTLAWLGLVVGGRAAIAWGQETTAHRAAATARLQLRQRLLGQLVRLGPGWLTGARSGEVTTLAGRGIDALDGYFARYLPQLVLAAVVPLVVLARVLPADIVAGLTIVVTLPLVPVFMALVGLGTAEANRRQLRQLERLSHHFLDVVCGLATLRVFGRARAQAATIGAVTAQYRRLTMRSLRLAFLSGLVLELLATLSVALVAVGIGLRLVGGTLDLRTALLVLILAPEAYLPLRTLGSQYHASAEGLAAAQEVFAVLETPVPRRGAAAPVPGPPELELDRTSVCYPDRDAPALAEFSLTVAPAEVVVLTGPSGTGKSTVLGLLLGFGMPTTGTVRVGGSDLRDVDPDTWLAKVAWLPQSPHLLPETVADNIGSTTLPSYLDDVDAGTRLTDAGRGVSAGQRQRIALARALARDAPVLLLDEPTAHLDEQTEARVVGAIREAAVGRTTLIVAHRPAVLALADRIVTLDPVESMAPRGRAERPSETVL
jgi:ATP-binding cassette subfamily C protein CydD/ATP-binding cassette subfamily C protein CydCD